MMVLSMCFLWKTMISPSPYSLVLAFTKSKLLTTTLQRSQRIDGVRLWRPSAVSVWVIVYITCRAEEGRCRGGRSERSGTVF